MIDLEADIPKKSASGKDVQCCSCHQNNVDNNDQLPTEITSLIGKKYTFKISIDDYNLKKLLPVFIVLRLSDDPEIFDYIRLVVTPIKMDTEATMLDEWRFTTRLINDYFSPDDSARDPSSDSSSEASSDLILDAHLILHETLIRRRSPMAFVPALPPVSGALSLVHADLIPSPKRIRSPESATDLEGCSKDSFEPYVDNDVERSDEIDIDPVEAVIEVCFDFADINRASGVDVRVMTVSRDDVETSARDPIIVSDDGDTPPVVPKVIPEPAQEGAAGSAYETLRDFGFQKRITTGLEEPLWLKSQRVNRLIAKFHVMHRELRQIRRLQFYDRVRVSRLEACARKHMGYSP
ncbi:hypothetical protein Tco_0765553 [Tanacetum coccineum]